MMIDRITTDPVHGSSPTLRGARAGAQWVGVVGAAAFLVAALFGLRFLQAPQPPPTTDLGSSAASVAANPVEQSPLAAVAPDPVAPKRAAPDPAPSVSPPAAAGPTPPPQDGPPIKNVMIFLVDTLRASHLGCYGYFRDTSPNIDKFAAESVLFERAYSVSPWTKTSCASLFTSMYPVAHGCHDVGDSAADSLVMMAELFKARGFRTRGFSSNKSCSGQFNLDQGFDEFTLFDAPAWKAAHPDRQKIGYVPVEYMMPDTMKFLDEVGEAPFFLYFHNTDPHWPYNPPSKYARWGDGNAWNLYDGEILYSDDYFGRVIDKLRKLGKLDETLIIFTADHGEEWADHGTGGHGHTLYNELLHVPLIFHHPSLKPARRTEIVRLIDVLPTLIELCGLDGELATIQGRSLTALLNGQPDPKPEEQFVFAEVMFREKIQALSLETDGWKIIWHIELKKFRGLNRREARNEWRLYYTRQDVGERINMRVVDAGEFAKMKRKLGQVRAEKKKAQPPGLRVSIPPETLEILKTLGS